MRFVAGCLRLQWLLRVAVKIIPPFQEGDFIWCAFPERENPAKPGPEHIAYVLAVSAISAPLGYQAYSALIAYTTSQPWPASAIPAGVYRFDAEAAASLGQGRTFVMDLRRLAAVPVTTAWFPRLAQTGNGVQGHMPKSLQRQYLLAVEDLLLRRAEIVQRLGPLWPGGSR